MTTWYRTGTVSVTNGSAAVTGSGTQWIDGAKKGDAMHLADGRVYEILTINSNTSITLASNYLGSTGSGQSYAIQPTRGVVKSVFDSLTQLLSNFSGYQSGPLLGRFGVGTPTEPSISNLNDQDTGLYFPAANQMAASAGGVLRWLLTTTGFTLNVPMTGTAVTQSAIDTTTGRLTKVGDGGLLTTAPPTLTLASAHTATGWYSYATTDADKPPGSGSGAVEVKRAGLGPSVTVVVAYPLAGGIWTRRTSDSGATWTAWERCYTTANTVGTVSQSGGVPTGAIVERGDNANGDYVRFADGTQICTVTAAAVDTTATAGSLFMHTNILTWTFPAAFAAPPAVSGGGGNLARWIAPNAPSNSNVQYRVYSFGSSGAASSPSLTADGRWF